MMSLLDMMKSCQRSKSDQDVRSGTSIQPDIYTGEEQEYDRDIRYTGSAIGVYTRIPASLRHHRPNKCIPST